MSISDSPAQFNVQGLWEMWMCPQGSTQSTAFTMRFTADSLTALNGAFSGNWTWVPANPFGQFTITITEGNPVGLKPGTEMIGNVLGGAVSGAMGGFVGDPQSPSAVWSAAKYPGIPG